eukprot:3731006-Alexandrium_andersonii.AAC.1
MSASLVGSEMCIRDSSRPARPLCSHARARRPALSQASPARLGLTARSAPVSYTHLTLPTICSV